MARTDQRIRQRRAPPGFPRRSGSRPRGPTASAPGRMPVAVCLAGLSPAVVTETLYALAVARRPPVVVRDVHVVTTAGAHPTVVAALLGPRGALARLRQQYGLPDGSLSCTPDRVHVLDGPGGRPLDDIRTAEESRAAGEGIHRLVRELAADPGIELHCSLAGGRKTMSALLATALQLHGRPGDRLYHVLVNDPFERIGDFHFPPVPPRRFRVGGRWVDSRRARIELAEVPFVALGAVVCRLGLDARSLGALAAEVEAEALGRLAPEAARVRLDAGRVEIGSGDVVRLPAQGIALYALYAELRRDCRAPGCAAGGACSGCHPTDDEVHDRRARLAELSRAAGARPSARLEGLLEPGQSRADQVEEFRAWLEETRSRLNARLRAALGRGPRGERYTVTSQGHATVEDRRRRGLKVPPALVSVLAPGETPR